MEIKLNQAEESEKSVLRQLVELYQYDFSEFDRADVDEHGHFGYSYLDHYWTEDTRHPFFIRVDGKLAGFVLISDYCYALDDAEGRSISEFFVMHKYRRLGVGRHIAYQVFDRYPGHWEVVQQAENVAAIAFWESVIGSYTGGNYKKVKVRTEDWDGQALLFTNYDAVTAQLTAATD